MTAIEIMFSPVEYIVTGFPLLKICPDPIHKLVQAHVTYQYLKKMVSCPFTSFMEGFFPSFFLLPPYGLYVLKDFCLTNNLISK